VVRPCIVLGPSVANYIAASLMAPPVAALLDGNNPRLQFIHEDDLVRLLSLCVEKQAAGVFNAVGEGTLSTRELAALDGKPAVWMPYRAVWAAVWGLKQLKLFDFNLPPGVLEFFRYSWVASGERARRELGFQPAHSTRDCFIAALERKQEILSQFQRNMKARGKR
jgi:UDP-glucose 4-epimerase